MNKSYRFADDLRRLGVPLPTHPNTQKRLRRALAHINFRLVRCPQLARPYLAAQFVRLPAIVPSPAAYGWLPSREPQMLEAEVVRA